VLDIEMYVLSQCAPKENRILLFELWVTVIFHIIL